MCAFRFTLSGCVQVLGCACFIIMSPLCLANSDAAPWEGINRPIFAFNDALDTYALKPLAQGYQFITPGVVQESIHNVFNNLGEVKNLANDVLQVKFHSAGVDTSRFLLNSTIGLVGLIDVATPMGLQRSDEDFGQTLGYWGGQQRALPGAAAPGTKHTARCASHPARRLRQSGSLHRRRAYA